MNSTLRPMRWWDIEAVLGIEREVFPDTAWSAAQFWSELAQPNRWYVVHDDGAGVCGYAGLMTVPPTADVQTIAVAPRAQGMGVGRTLLQALLSEAEDAGCTEVLLEVRADNERAIEVYDVAGFESIARRSSYYGPGSDAVIMRRRRRP